VAVDGPTTPFHFGLARRAFQWPLLDVEKPSFRLAELPLPGAESAPHFSGLLNSLGVRRLWHVSQQHCCCHNVLACSRETADGLLRLYVSDDLLVYLSSSSADTFARRVRKVLLKDLLKQDKALTILVEFHLELS